jgi:signal transduction histidine kinase
MLKRFLAIFNSLETKALLVVGFLVTFTIVISVFYTIYQSHIERNNALERKAQLLAAIQADAIGRAFVERDNKQIRFIMEALLKERDVVKVQLFDAQAREYMRVGYGDAEIASLPLYTADAVIADMVRSAKVVGRLEVTVTRQHVLKSLETQLYISALGMSILINFILIAVNMAMRVITRPLNKMAMLMQEYAETQDKIEMSEFNQKDEIGQLAVAFNQMVEKLNISNRDLIHAKVQAETANLLQKQFLANMSHELRTPMHAVVNFAGIAKSRLEKGNLEKIPDYLDKIRDSAQRLIVLLNNLLDLSKLEAGNVQLVIESRSLPRIVKACIGEVESLFDAKQLKVRVEQPSHDVMIDCDRDKIVQVIINLLSNAIKFSPEHGLITLRINDIARLRGQDAVAFSVSDEGIGVAEDELERVFDKFYQSKNTKTGAGGTGLGLAISKEIIEAHGGFIAAQLNSGKGVTFTFTLPIKSIIKTE